MPRAATTSGSTPPDRWWESLQEAATIDELETAVSGAFSVLSPEQCRADIESLIAELEEHGLVEVVDDDQAS